MTWKLRYLLLGILFLWPSFFFSCGIRKKTVERSRIDSTYYSKALMKDYQANITTQITTENTTLDLSEFKAIQTAYDTLGRVTLQTVIERRGEHRAGQKMDSTIRDSSFTKEILKIDSGKVKKEDISKNKNSNTTFAANIPWFAWAIGAAVIILCFIIFLRWIKK